MSNLKEIREKCGLTQKQLAEQSGVSIRMIQHYEQGFKDIKKAQATTVHSLSKVLQCDIGELLDDERLHSDSKME